MDTPRVSWAESTAPSDSKIPSLERGLTSGRDQRSRVRHINQGKVKRSFQVCAKPQGTQSGALILGDDGPRRPTFTSCGDPAALPPTLFGTLKGPKILPDLLKTSHR